MSQFIVLSSKNAQQQNLQKDVITGKLSRLQLFNRSSTLYKYLQNQEYIRRNVEEIVKVEENNAKKDHDLSLNQNLIKLKNNLQLYARSKSFRLQSMSEYQQKWNKVNFDEGLSPIEEVKCKAKSTIKIDKEDKIIFVDRKYNNALAIKAASISQMQLISKNKEYLRRKMSEQYESPLAIKLRKFATHVPQDASKKDKTRCKEERSYLGRRKMLDNKKYFK